MLVVEHLYNIDSSPIDNDNGNSLKMVTFITFMKLKIAVTRGGLGALKTPLGPKAP